MLVRCSLFNSFLWLALLAGFAQRFQLLTRYDFVDIEENGVRLHLTVVDTPGFGDFVNNDDRSVGLSFPGVALLATRTLPTAPLLSHTRSLPFSPSLPPLLFLPSHPNMLLTHALNDSWKPIVENIESRFDSYLEQENRVNRTKIVDNRVHACLYFIQPTGHSYVSHSFF